MLGRNLTKNTKRAELLGTLSDLARKFSMQTVFLHQAIAQTVGLNATDTRCLDLLGSHPNDMLTAGRLSDLTGLTTGAITHVLDRLEKRGLIERVRNSEDHRKIFVRVRGASIKPLLPKYESLGKAYMTLIERYKDRELRLILSYMEEMSEMTERLMADTIAAPRDG